MSIRTTVTLDDDVLERAKEFGRKRGISFRQALNDLVRAGILHEQAGKPLKPFRITPHKMGIYPDLNYDSMTALEEQVEGPWHK